MALTERKHTGEFILSEAPGTQSRDTVTVTVPAATRFQPGTVLGQIAATDKYAAFDDAVTTGLETAAGILYGELDNSEGESPVDFDGVIVNANAEVRADDLIWGEGVDEEAGTGHLRALGIKARS